MDSRPFCPVMASFCGCCSIRFGANFIGWFNFVLNALYIGALVKSLASVRDGIDILYDRLDGDYVHYVLPTFHRFKNIADGCHDQKEIKELTAMTFDKPGEWAEYVATHTELLNKCKLIKENITLVDSIRMIEDSLMPQFYWSSAIPLIVLIVSIGWLTSVESGSVRLMKAIGYCFVSSVVMQIVLQLAFIAHFHGQLTGLFKNTDEKEKSMISGDGVHWSLWFVFLVYSLFNVYAIPIVITYLHKRSQTEHQILDDKNEEEPKYPNAYNRMGVRNRSFRIEDDPMGDNFRQSLEDIRVGFRDTVPKTPALSRVTSLTDEPIKEEKEEDLVDTSK